MEGQRNAIGPKRCYELSLKVTEGLLNAEDHSRMPQTFCWSNGGSTKRRRPHKGTTNFPSKRQRVSQTLYTPRKCNELTIKASEGQRNAIGRTKMLRTSVKVPKGQRNAVGRSKVLRTLRNRTYCQWNIFSYTKRYVFEKGITRKVPQTSRKE